MVCSALRITGPEMLRSICIRRRLIPSIGLSGGCETIQVHVKIIDYSSNRRFRAWTPGVLGII